MRLCRDSEISPCGMEDHSRSDFDVLVNGFSVRRHAKGRTIQQKARVNLHSISKLCKSSWQGYFLRHTAERQGPDDLGVFHAG